MSKRAQTPRLLQPSEVNRKIITKQQKSKSQPEWFDHLGKYRHEHTAEYDEKRKKFFACAQHYNRMNTETLMCRNVRLHKNYEDMLDLDFLKEKERGEEECDAHCCCLKCTPNKTGRLLRQRSLRQMTPENVASPEGACLIEPWFKRYLVLNKFIWAARSVIIQNRLLKVLDKLKPLTAEDVREIENKGIENNNHCHPVFVKFL